MLRNCTGHSCAELEAANLVSMKEIFAFLNATQ